MALDDLTSDVKEEKDKEETEELKESLGVEDKEDLENLEERLQKMRDLYIQMDSRLESVEADIELIKKVLMNIHKRLEDGS